MNLTSQDSSEPESVPRIESWHRFRSYMHYRNIFSGNAPMPQHVAHHSYLHRMARLFNYLKQIEMKNPKRYDDLVFKSALASNIAVASMLDKLTIESATLGYLPVYCNFKWKDVTANFGADVCGVIREVREVSDALMNLQNPSAQVNGASKYAKDVYMIQCYVDVVELFTIKKLKGSVDGRDYTISAEGDTVNYDGEEYNIHHFHKYIMELLLWKIDYLKFSCVSIAQALRELCKLYEKREGFEFQLADDFVYSNPGEETTYI